MEYEKAIELLLRTVQSHVFKFVLVRYNSLEVVRIIANELENHFPSRPLVRLRSRDMSYHELLRSLEQNANGFIFIEDFDQLIANDELARGLNQRRDKLTKLPLVIVAFLPKSDSYLNMGIKKMPDLWSIRNLLIDIETYIPPTDIRLLDTSSFEVVPVNKDELAALLAQIVTLEKRKKNEDRPLLANLYRLVADLYVNLYENKSAAYYYQKSLAFYQETQQEPEIADISFQLGRLAFRQSDNHAAFTTNKPNDAIAKD
jgi:hypothetical protein